MVLLVIGMVEFGVLFYNKAVITNASREGARAGIVFRGDGTVTPPICVAVPNSEIQTAVNNYVQSRIINFGSTTSVNTQVTRTGTSPDCDLNRASGGVTVLVSYAHTYLALPNFIGLGNSITINAATTMRRE
jgi:Flp pilus assembly protein TadG